MKATPVRVIGALLTGTAVAVAVLDDGGFNPRPRVLFGCLAAAALLVTASADWSGVMAAIRQPAVVALLLLGALGAISAVWTVGNGGSALRWGLVTAGYGALVICGAALARDERGATYIAVLIALLAVATSVIGIVAAAHQTGPYAEYSSGYWEPGGTLEYAPALALLCVSALPVLLTGMCSHRRSMAALGVAGAAICAVAIALSHSRAEAAFAVCVCIYAACLPARTVRSSRARTLAALAILAPAAAAGYAIAGYHVSETAHADARADLLLLGVTVVCSTALWLLLRFALDQRASRTRTVVPRAAVAGGAAVVVALAAVALALSGTRMTGPIPHPGNGGFTHGRVHLWKVSLEVAEQRPLYGFGADSFLAATFSKQDQTQTPIPFAHDMPIETAVELGIPGVLLALAMYVAVAYAWWRRRHSAQAWLLGAAAVAFLAANLIDWPWHLAGSGAVWALALGGLLATAPDSSAVDLPAKAPRGIESPAIG